MSIQQRPNMENIWAAMGGIAVPSQEKILEGWVEEIPLNIIANWIEQRQDKALLYLLQQGIADWGSSTEYPKNCFTKRNGVVYISTDPSIGIDPESEGNVAWKIAFDNYGAAKEVADLVQEIIEQEGRLPLYVSKANPVMDGSAEAPSFRADVGIPATLEGSNEFGFSFQGEDNTGFFKSNSGVMGIYKAGVLLGKFNTNKANLEDTDFVTVSMIKDLMKRYEIQVGTSIVTVNPANPATYLGYGTWIQDCQGRAIVGVSLDNTAATPDWKKSVDREFGTDTETLTIEQIPLHNHPEGLFNGSGVWASVKDMVVEDSYNAGELIRYGNRGTPDWSFDQGTLSDNRWLTLKPEVNAVGGGQAHNNVQESQTKYIFTRTA